MERQDEEDKNYRDAYYAVCRPYDVEWSPADRDDISQMNNLQHLSDDYKKYLQGSEIWL